MTRARAGSLVLGAFLLVPAGNALAQGSGALGMAMERGTGAEVVADSYGLGSQDYWVSAAEFTVKNHYTTPELMTMGTFPYAGFVVDSGEGDIVYAPLRLPAGARLTSMKCYFRNYYSVAAGRVSLIRAWHDSATNTPGFAEIAAATVLTSPGYTQPSVAFDETIRYVDGTRQNWYLLEATLIKDPGSQQHATLAGCNVVWNRQVTPAPASGTFADVPIGHQQHRFVEALVAAGITAGCGGGNYCPDQPVTRGQMAVFLAAALGLHFPN